MSSYSQCIQHAPSWDVHISNKVNWNNWVCFVHGDDFCLKYSYTSDLFLRGELISLFFSFLLAMTRPVPLGCFTWPIMIMSVRLTRVCNIALVFKHLTFSCIRQRSSHSSSLSRRLLKEKIFFMSPLWRDTSTLCTYWFIDLAPQPTPVGRGNVFLTDRQELIHQRRRRYSL